MGRLLELGGRTSVGAGHRSAKMCNRSSAPTPDLAETKQMGTR